MSLASPESRARFATDFNGTYASIVAVFCGLLLISNIGATKLISLGPLIFDGGAILFPLVYVVGDVLTEVYGWKGARRAIILGFALGALAALTFWLVQIAPPGPGYENQAAFEAVLGFVPRIVLASLAGFMVGQFLNAYVLVKIKQRTGEKGMWARLFGSTAAGELADTIVFCTVAFGGVISGSQLLNYIAVGYVYKCAVELLVMPITYRVIALVKSREPSYGLQTPPAELAYP